MFRAQSPDPKRTSRLTGVSAAAKLQGMVLPLGYIKPALSPFLTPICCPGASAAGHVDRRRRLTLRWECFVEL